MFYTILVKERYLLLLRFCGAAALVSGLSYLAAAVPPASTRHRFISHPAIKAGTLYENIETLTKAGDFSTAARILGIAEAKYGKTDEYMACLADLAYAKGQKREAYAAYKWIAHKDSSNRVLTPTLLYQFGKLSEELNQTQEARFSYHRLIELYNNRFWSSRLRANIGKVSFPASIQAKDLSVLRDQAALFAAIINEDALALQELSHSKTSSVANYAQTLLRVLQSRASSK